MIAKVKRYSTVCQIHFFLNNTPRRLRDTVQESEEEPTGAKSATSMMAKAKILPLAAG